MKESQAALVKHGGGLAGEVKGDWRQCRGRNSQTCDVVGKEDVPYFNRSAWENPGVASEAEDSVGRAALGLESRTWLWTSGVYDRRSVLSCRCIYTPDRSSFSKKGFILAQGSRVSRVPIMPGRPR